MYATEVLSRTLDALGLGTEMCSIELVHHPVDINWRQRHPTPQAQIRAVAESLVQHGPFEGSRLAVRRMAPDHLLPRRNGLAISVTSRVWRGSTVLGHLPLMNLHPVGYSSVEEMAQAVALVTNDMPGHLLRSGRFFHFYGARLLNEREWFAFLAQFLMPCTLVSPRYVGHSLYRGFCALRLNAVPPVKPTEPHLALVLGH